MSSRSQLIIFFCAVSLMGAALGIHESTFNNFLKDAFEPSAVARGGLEFPRELPGFLVVLMAGLLCMLPVTRVGVVGASTLAVGMVGLAYSGRNYPLMVVMMMIGSAGMHLLQPVGTSVALGLSEGHNRGKRLGQMGAISNVGMILGTGFVWLAFSRTAPQYRFGFLLAAGLAVVVALLFLSMRIPELHQPRARLVIRRRFALYYVLEFMFGARKQIFITFGPWVLIEIYGLPATSIAKLLLLASAIGIVFKPLAGRAIDRFGERNVMVVDGMALALICLGYGYALNLTHSESAARLLACSCYILDNLLFALGTGRSIYLSRRTESQQELTSSLAMGVSINHIASMVIPFFAGIIWVGLGYEVVFAAAAALAVGISALSSFVPGKPRFNRS